MTLKKSKNTKDSTTHSYHSALIKNDHTDFLESALEEGALTYDEVVELIS